MTRHPRLFFTVPVVDLHAMGLDSLTLREVTVPTTALLTLPVDQVQAVSAVGRELTALMLPGSQGRIIVTLSHEATLAALAAAKPLHLLANPPLSPSIEDSACSIDPGPDTQGWYPWPSLGMATGRPLLCIYPGICVQAQLVSGVIHNTATTLPESAWHFEGGRGDVEYIRILECPWLTPGAPVHPDWVPPDMRVVVNYQDYRVAWNVPIRDVTNWRDVASWRLTRWSEDGELQS